MRALLAPVAALALLAAAVVGEELPPPQVEKELPPRQVEAENSSRRPLGELPRYHVRPRVDRDFERLIAESLALLFCLPMAFLFAAGAISVLACAKRTREWVNGLVICGASGFLFAAATSVLFPDDPSGSFWAYAAATIPLCLLGLPILAHFVLRIRARRKSELKGAFMRWVWERTR